jgi:peptide/nickel transport system substrate-binding protein
MAIDTKWFWAPEHYHRKLLPEFIGEEKALQIAKEKGFGNIKDLGNQTGYYYWLWPERPVIRAWKAVNHPSESRYILERNPYYFKTDPEGNQLPYIDRIVVDLTEDDLFTLKAISGELDCQTIASSEYTLLMENVKKGDYRVVKWKDTNGASDSIQLNQTVKDPGLRKLFQDIRFRAGLSVAINREEINEIVHGGLEIPRQASLLEGLPHFSATWAKKFAEYDPDRAARYFDEVGLPWDKGHKYRLRPDGSELVMIVHLWAGPTREKVIELVKSYWEAVGIKTIMKVVERAFLEELRNSNDLQIGVWGFHILDVKLRPDILVPLRMLNYWSGHYGPYYESKGKMGIKPEGDILLLQEYWNKAVSATTKDEMNMWADKIVALHEKNVWAIGITGGSPTLYVVKNNFRNFPEGLYQADELRNIGVANPCQFFIRQQ